MAAGELGQCRKTADPDSNSKPGSDGQSLAPKRLWPGPLDSVVSHLLHALRLFTTVSLQWFYSQQFQQFHPSHFSVGAYFPRIDASKLKSGVCTLIIPTIRTIASSGGVPLSVSSSLVGVVFSASLWRIWCRGFSWILGRTLL
ncbi:hypothetical protein B0T10DRAFT_466985 [Thelonectria olida]|uniref:Uncharacterized protein n=1 Tax=Thelonectria olida TaxID=1576542 RepID=A0A9P8VQH3_9HYPO|nr:hypothetical protein B0T10DRAFT_466985 [Thelonectria olida]